MSDNRSIQVRIQTTLGEWVEGEVGEGTRDEAEHLHSLLRDTLSNRSAYVSVANGSVTSYVPLRSVAQVEVIEREADDA